MLPIAYHLGHLWVRRTTTVATVLGVAAAALVVASSRMATDGLAAAMGSAGRADLAVLVVAGSDGELGSQLDARSAARAAALATAAAGVAPESASRELVVTVTVERRGERGVLSNLVLRGVDAAAAAQRRDLRLVAGRAAVAAADELMVGRAVAGRFAGLGLGDRFEIAPGRSAAVVGVFAAGGSATESEIWGPRELVAAATGREGIASSVRVALPRPGGLDAVRASLAQVPELALEAISERELLERQGRRVAMLVRGLGALVGGLLALAAALGAAVTLHAQVAHRRREIAVLRALGWTRAEVLLSFLLEALLLAGAGGALGALAAALLDGQSTSLVNVASYTEVRVALSWSPSATALALALAAGVGVAGGLSPALRAALVKPSAGMRRA